jgi:hypothetical protein
MEPRIVSGDTPTRQYAPLEYRLIDVTRYDRGQFIKFMVARGGGIVGADGIPPRKRSILLDQLPIIRKWRHDQAPTHKHNRSSFA